MKKKKVVWLCNTLIADIAIRLKLPVAKPESWIKGIYNMVLEDENIELLYLFPNTDNNIVYSYKNVVFRGYRQSRCNQMVLKNDLEQAIVDFKPDVIHIHGTEFLHSHILFDITKKLGISNKVIVSIQGLVHIYALHFYANLPWNVVLFPTFRDIYRRQTVFEQKKAFEKRGYYEVALLSEVPNVIGRTDWDLACVRRINEKANYYKCNEILREAFYREEKWNIDKCQKYSIFVSQSNYPIKGFHLIIKAFAEVIKKYPYAHLYTTGDSPFAESMIGKIKQQSYKKYLARLITEYDLKNKITFLGYLNEEQMYERYLKTHVFVSASSIENSPNSVGEAMILGVPTLSSDVGGVKNMMVHEKTGFLYPSDEEYMIPFYIDKIFGNNKVATQISLNAIRQAEKIFDRDINYGLLKDIYNSINE